VSLLLGMTESVIPSEGEESRGTTG